MEVKANDPFTGFEDPEAYDAEVREAWTKAMEIAEKVRPLKTNQAFLDLCSYMTKQRDSFFSRLKIETDIQKIYKLQSLIYAFEFLDNVLEQLLQNGSIAETNINE